jgi:hypothetical protein
MGTWACFQNVLRNEGPLGFYKGLIPQLVGQVPEKALRLFVVEQIRSLNPNPGDVSYPVELLSGLAAGTVQVLITNPAEIVKVRLQVQGAELAQRKAQAAVAGHEAAAVARAKGPVDILRELGVRGMYRGASACFLRDIPFSGIYFSSYAWLKENLRSGTEPLHSLELFACASAAGVAAASVTTPADVLKTRMQVEAKRGEGYKGLTDCFLKVTKSEGYSALFKGVVPRVLRSSPQYGVMLLSYELLQRMFEGEINTSISMEGLDDRKWVKMLLLEDKLGVLLENSWEAPSSFTKFNGGFKHISVGGGRSIWAISIDEDIYAWNGNSWQQTPGAKLRQLSAAEDGSVWGVNQEGQAYRWNVDLKTWQHVPCEWPLVHLAVGNEREVWGVINNNGEIDPRSRSNVVHWDGKNWVISGNEVMKLVSCGADGTLWGINQERFTFRFKKDTQEWVQMPGSFKQVSVGSARHVWGVDSKDTIYKWKSGRWQRVTASATPQHISVASDGSIVTVDKKDGQVNEISIHRPENGPENNDSTSGSRNINTTLMIPKSSHSLSSASSSATSSVRPSSMNEPVGSWPPVLYPPSEEKEVTIR